MIFALIPPSRYALFKWKPRVTANVEREREREEKKRKRMHGEENKLRSTFTL